MGDDASYFPGFHFRDLSSGCRIVPMSPGSSLTKRIATKTKEDKAEVIEAASDLVADGVHTGTTGVIPVADLPSLYCIYDIFAPRTLRV